MKKNEIYSGNVVAHHFPDKGTVETQEAKVTVKGTLPGQTVSFVLKKKRGGRMEGRLFEVLKKAPYEIPSPCPHFGICGGCGYQNLSYESQLSLKESDIKELLKNALAPFGDEALENGRIEDLSFFEGVIPSPVKAGYRNKMEYSFGNERLDGPMELGMHKAGRHNDVITVDSCLISDGDFRLILKATLDFFRKKDASFYRKQTGEGYLRHLIIRKGSRTGEILVNLVTTSQFCVSSHVK